MTVTTESVGGIVAGRNPLEYSTSSPYTLFLFQTVFIITLCHILNYPLRKIRQPRVIAEVLSGIILGPTVLGRIPNFTSTCFSEESKPSLVLVSNVGIILFLFIVGLEVDLQYIRSNAKTALSVGFINMAVPFGLGCGIAKGLYDEYSGSKDDESTIAFTTYMVFIAVALCITAFPVLARILVELNLIGDQVGTVVLSAGIINDLVGWILLALVVTLANADNGIQTLYILLLAIAWVIFLVFPARRALLYYLEKFTDDLTTGYPSQSSMVILIAMVFVSAFYTDIIGVHPIFGAFLVGVIVPRTNRYVIKITEKLEDLVHLVMIPIYFAVAGLSVNLGELNRGVDWGYVVAVTALAMFGKVGGGYLAAKINGFSWRNSLAVGVLMSCKGIVEIVVLNVGLNANIISTRVYSMFVVMALLTTFLTTPLAIWVYPAHYRQSSSEWGSKEKEEPERDTLLPPTTTNLALDTLDGFSFSKVILLLREINTVSTLMMFLKEIGQSAKFSEVKAVHIREFTSRTSDLLEASSVENKVLNDRDKSDSYSILAIVEAFNSFFNAKFSAESVLAPLKNYMMAVNNQVSSPSDFLLTSMNYSTIVYSQAGSQDRDCDYKMLMETSKCHVGVLLIGEIQPHSFPQYIKLVFNQDDRLSNSDLLNLYLLRSLVKSYSKVQICIRSSANHNVQFESQYSQFLKGISISTSYFKDPATIFKVEESLKEAQWGRCLLLVTYDFMEQVNEREIMQLGLKECHDILLVKASAPNSGSEQRSIN